MIFWVPVSWSVPHLLHLLSPDLVPPSLPSGSHLRHLRDLQLTYRGFQEVFSDRLCFLMQARPCLPVSQHLSLLTELGLSLHRVFLFLQPD